MIDLNKKQKDSDSSSVTNKEGNTLVNQQNNDISVQHQEFPKKSSYKDFFTLKGRFGRLKYFTFMLPLSLIEHFVERLPDRIWYDLFEDASVVVFFYLCAAIFYILMFLIEVQRLHDLNISAWYYVAFLVFIIVITAADVISEGFIKGIDIVTSLLLLFVKGTKGPNKYGKDPLASH